MTLWPGLYKHVMPRKLWNYWDRRSAKNSFNVLQRGLSEARMDGPLEVTGND